MTDSTLDLNSLLELTISNKVAELLPMAVKEAMKDHKSPIQTIEIKEPNKPTKKISGRYHGAFNKIVRYVKTGKIVALVGGTGSGKTYLAKQVADALDLDFYINGTILSKHELVGHKDVNGEYCPTSFYNAFTKGGLYLMDEADSWAQKAFLASNSALSNRLMDFPIGHNGGGGQQEAHPDFICMMAMNTTGGGATREYVGRNPMDAAILARISYYVPVDYDEKLERDLSINIEWTEYVLSVRHAVDALGMRTIIHPRMNESGALALEQGVSRKDVENDVVFFNVEPNDVKKIKAKMKELKQAKEAKETIEPIDLTPSEPVKDLDF